ncbi:MAG: isomerase [Opitutus sp.]|nr:isomerase [Opitutus sp.]
MKFFWVDAFAGQPFTGNPAGVVPLESWPDDAHMQRIAFENGLAETAFFVRTGAARFQLRWFTPAVEVDLCGHATLASAFVVFSELGQAGDRLTFDSRSGPLLVSRGADGSLELDFPATPPREENSAALRATVSAAIGTEVSWLGRSPFDLFAVVAQSAAVASLQPDLPKIASLGGRGLIVTAAGGPAAIDFVSRFFAPQAGVPEDPVTGSAHCALTPYWAARLGRSVLRARQLSRRGGDLHCTLAGDRVRLAGRAVLYLRGDIVV